MKSKSLIELDQELTNELNQKIKKRKKDIINNILEVDLKITKHSTVF